jgi:hypothetical protein
MRATFMVEYGEPDTSGGHIYRPAHGNSLQVGEKVHRHVCCWFQVGSGGNVRHRRGRRRTAGYPDPNWAAVYITDLRLLIRLSGGTRLSGGPTVSVWGLRAAIPWRPQCRVCGSE